MEIGKITQNPVFTVDNNSSGQKIIKTDKPVVDYTNVDNLSDVDIDNKIDFSISNINTSIGNNTAQTKTLFEELGDFQKNHTKEETYQYFKDTLSDLSKNDKDGFKDLVSSILRNGNAHYDYSKKKAKIADNQAEILEKMLTAKGQLDNAICTTIHGFMMDTLHELGIDATLIIGEENEGHATLMYQLEDGKYIFNDYGNSKEVKADNIIQAVKIVQRETHFNNWGGYVQILGDGSDFYEEYAFKKEAAYGDEIDSKNANKTTAFKNNEITGKSNISLNVDEDINIAQTTVDGKAEYINEDAQVKFSIGGQYRLTNGQTDNFNGASSIGFKAEVAKNFTLKNDGQITADATVIGNNVKGNSVGNNDFGLIKEQAGIAYSTNIYEEKDTILKNSVRFQEDVVWGRSTNMSRQSDIRLQLEDGLKISKETDNLTLESIINAGIMANYSLSDYANQKYLLDFGGKGNIEGSVEYKLDDNTTIGAKAEGFLSADKSHANYGACGEVTFRKEFYNPTAIYSDSAFQAAIGYKAEATDINVGGFNENIQNEQNLYFSTSYDLGNKMNVSGTYNYEVNQKQHKLSFGLKYNFD